MDYIDFAGTSYLGLNKNEQFLELIYKGIEKYGANFGGSRFNNSIPDVYDQFEQFVSDKLGCQSTVLSSSGTLAGVLLSDYLKRNEYSVYISHDLHPSLKCNFESFFEFHDISELKALNALNNQRKHIAVLVNSINSITLNSLDFKDFNEIKSLKHVLLIVDDSHGIGIRGDDGWGISADLKKAGVQYVIIFSLAKALASEGGIVSGDNSIISDIKQSSMWGGASPPPPYFFYALMNGEKLIKEQQAKLKENINYLQELIRGNNGISFIDDFPVFLLNTRDDQYEKLMKRGIQISSFRYPTKNDPLVERAVVNSNHSFDDINKLVLDF